MDTLEVSILGRKFKLACTPTDKAALQRAVSVVDNKMNSIRVSGRVVGLDNIAIMAALQIAHESLSGSNQDNPFLALDIESIERRIEAVEQQLDAGLKSAETPAVSGNASSGNSASGSSVSAPQQPAPMNGGAVGGVQGAVAPVATPKTASLFD